MAKNLPFKQVDLTVKTPVLTNRFDLAMCCEVAEHLDERHANVLVWHLTNASDTIFLTAAEVGQGGLNHVNEQPNSYWIEKFSKNGYLLDEKLTEDARDTFSACGVIHYLAKPMIFRRSAELRTLR